MENVDKRRDIKIVKHWDRTNCNKLGAKYLICKPNFNSLAHFSENMVAIELNRVNTFYDKPLHLGFCILELSKWVMYDLCYDFLKQRFGNSFCLNYMDTDSFILTFYGVNLFKDISTEDLKMRFDTSDFQPDNRDGIPLVNKKEIGIMKDENGGKIMTEFIGLKPKNVCDKSRRRGRNKKI